MAWADKGYQTVVSLAASNGRTVNVILKYDATVTTEALAETAYAAWATDYLAIGAGVPKRKDHMHVFENDAFVLPTSQDAEFGEHAILVTSIDGEPTKTAVLNIPMPVTTVVYLAETGEDRDVVDKNEALVSAYVANWTAAQKLTLSDGEKSAGNIVRGKRAR